MLWGGSDSPGDEAMEVTFTDRELDVMGVLWERGPSTVTEVREGLADELAYTTVLTVLRVLEEKGHVGHEEEGRAPRGGNIDARGGRPECPPTAHP